METFIAILTAVAPPLFELITLAIKGMSGTPVDPKEVKDALSKAHAATGQAIIDLDAHHEAARKAAEDELQK